MDNLNFSLIDLKAFSEPTIKLIESVSNAIGSIYEPTSIRRKARAEADAAIIYAQSQVEVQEIQIRAVKRLRDKELRRQRNIESITRKAITALPSSVSSEPVDEDWIFDFYERSQDISDEQIQEIWARILAGEVTQPGSFSKRTLETVKTLSANEAQLFVKCCPFVWNGEDLEDRAFPIIFVGDKTKFPTQAGLNFTALQILQAAGLMVIGQFVITHPGNLYHIEYFGSRYLLTLPERNIFQFPTGQALFTEAGKELLRMIKAEPDREYEQSIIEYWQKNERIVIEKL
jgi:hypothetical protein